MQKLRAIVLSLIISPLLLAGPAMLVAAPVAADSVSDACAGIGVTGGSCNSSTGANGLNKLVTAILEILTVVAGAAAVIMIILAGLRFTNSGGDSNKVAGARSALTYAVVGLVVVALAQLIVHFVLSAAKG